MEMITGVPYRMTDVELSATLKQLHKLKTKRDELNSEIERQHDALKRHLAAIEADELTQCGWTISFKEVETEKIDLKAFRDEMPEIAAYFTRKSRGRRFFVRSVA